MEIENKKIASLDKQIDSEFSNSISDQLDKLIGNYVQFSNVDIKLYEKINKFYNRSTSQAKKLDPQLLILSNKVKSENLDTFLDRLNNMILMSKNSSKYIFHASNNTKEKTSQLREKFLFNQWIKLFKQNKNNVLLIRKNYLEENMRGRN